MFTSLPFFKVSRAIHSELAQGGRFEELKSPLNSLSHLSFIQFRAPVAKVGEAHGLAVANTLKKAQIIAYFEYLDRKAFHLHSERLGLTSTNGIAAHKFKLLATQAAKNELYERDAILAHWYTQTPMRRLPLPREMAPVAEEFSGKNLEIQAFQTSLGFAATQLVLIVDRTTGGFVTGSSAGKGTHEGLKKALLEAVINFFFGNYGNTTENLLSNLARNRFSTLESHRTHWLYRGSVPNWLKNGTTEDVERLILKPTEAQMRFKTQLISYAPFPVVAVQSAMLLPFKVGLPDKAEFAILTERLGPGYSLYGDEPHPIF